MKRNAFVMALAVITLTLMWREVEAGEPTLRKAVKVTFSVTLGSLRFMGSPPEAVGVVGDVKPLRTDRELPPALVLRAAKEEPGRYSGTIEFLASSTRDVPFALMLKVEGRWRKEPGNLGTEHVMILDSLVTEQNVSLRYVTEQRRFVAESKGGLIVDNYVAASTLAESRKDAASARTYEYYNVLALLSTGRLLEADNAYNRYCASSPLGLSAREGYDHFYGQKAFALAKMGKNEEAVQSLKGVQPNVGDAGFQEGVKSALAQILQDGGRQAEARAVYRELIKLGSRSPETEGLRRLALARSYLREPSRDSVDLGEDMLRSLIASDPIASVERAALLALAAVEREDKNNKSAKMALKQASVLGTTQERLATKLQLSTLQFAKGDYAGVHEMCRWILEDGQPGRHLPRILYLDAVSLKKLGKTKESTAQFKRLYAAFPDNPYTRYAAAILTSPVYRTPALDSLAKGGVHQ